MEMTSDADTWSYVDEFNRKIIWKTFMNSIKQSQETVHHPLLMMYFHYIKNDSIEEFAILLKKRINKKYKLNPKYRIKYDPKTIRKYYEDLFDEVIHS